MSYAIIKTGGKQFRAEPGKEDVVLKIAAAYEAASQRRVPPPAFGPLPRD